MLKVENLTVEFPNSRPDRPSFVAVEDVSLTILPGEIHGLVGESGAGKSTIGAAIMGLLAPPGRVVAGKMHLDEIDLRALTPAEAHTIRGSRISMIFQDPQTSLNPLMTIEAQILETILAHDDIGVDKARARAIALLEEIGIDNAARRIQNYPHQFSGGMRQRVVIALALCTNPQIIIADEPTTALDVAVQSQVLELIRHLARDRAIGILLITHDVGVIAQVTDKVTVLRGGHLVESGPTVQVLTAPSENYTLALMSAVPPLHKRIARFVIPNLSRADNHDFENEQSSVAKGYLLDALESQAGKHTGPSLEAMDISVRFGEGRKHLFAKQDYVYALDKVSLTISPGSVTAIVGESGSGKSTLARVVTGLIQPFEGELRLGGKTLALKNSRTKRDQARRIIQMIFQDPYSSLNPRHRIGDILAEPLWLYSLENDKAARMRLAQSMLTLVGMPSDSIERYPHQFSGGQRQRIAIARALLARPGLLICDEPTSALDVSIQAQILNLFKDLQQKFGLTILFIGHDLAVVRQMADDIALLRAGKIVEKGNSDEFFEQPKSEYGRELLRLTPSLDAIY